MAAIALTKAKETVRSTIAGEVHHFLVKLDPNNMPASATVGILSNGILDCLLADPKSAKALLSLLAAPAATAQDGSEWLKTDEAAKRMGFSRPYVAALIDAGEFGSSVSKSEKGHRRVKTSAVDKWIRDHSVVGSAKELEKTFSQTDTAEFFEAPVLSSDETAQLTKRINDGRSQSIKYRPVRKHA